MSTPDLAGTWTLRSFNPTFVTGTSEEHEFIAGALDLTLRTAPDPFYLEGTIGWRGDPPRDPPGVLDVSGTIDQRPGREHQRFYLTATGRSQTPTAGWQYDYHGHMTRTWLKGDKQIPALVGSVIRQKAHGDSPAGTVFPFIAVKQ